MISLGIRAMVWVFSAIVVAGAGVFLVLDALDKIESIDKRVPWLRKALARREAVVAALLIAIVLLVGDGYELLTKEIPEKVDLAKEEMQLNLKFPTIPAPIIQKAGVTIIHGACKLTETEINPARSQQVCTGGTGVPSLRDKVLAINARLTENDRNRFSDALAEFEKSLTDGRGLFYKINSEGGQLNNDLQANNSPGMHERNLKELEDEGWQYQKAFPQLRAKWQRKFEEQTAYIFGDNPDNEGPNALLNAVSTFRGFLGAWKTVPTCVTNANFFFGLANNQYQTRMKMFADWNGGCLRRLAEMRNSIR